MNGVIIEKDNFVRYFSTPCSVQCFSFIWKTLRKREGSNQNAGIPIANFHLPFQLARYIIPDIE